MSKNLMVTFLVLTLGAESVVARETTEEMILRVQAVMAKDELCRRFVSEAYCLNLVSDLIASRHIELHAPSYISYAYSRLPKQKLSSMVSDQERISQARSELRTIAKEVARHWMATGQLPLAPTK